MSIPVGPKMLGRVVNIFGETIDGGGRRVVKSGEISSLTVVNGLSWRACRSSLRQHSFLLTRSAQSVITIFYRVQL